MWEAEYYLFKIHDLDGNDQSNIEKELGGPMRSIKFIHKAAGVNRPLTSQDDQVRESGKILYSDQINKVANALKDIGDGILSTGKTFDKKPFNDQASSSSKSKTKTNLSLKMLFGLLALPLVFVLAYYLMFNYNKAIPTSLTKGKSLAILPFTDISPAKDQEWFSAGLTEEINNSLAHVPNLILRARTSSAYFHEQNLSLQQIADSLNVNYILQGSVRKMGDQLKISTQLVEGKTGTNIWSNTYDRTMSDIFNIQKDISENIAKALDILLDDTKRTKMHSIGTRNVEAYEAYLKGDVYYKLAHTFSASDSSLYKANEYFEEAIAFDPTFAQPYARHQDFFSHYFVDGKHGIYNYVFEGLEDKEISRFISSDLQSAIKYSKHRSSKITYQLDQVFFTDNWQPAAQLMEEFEGLDEEEQMIVENSFSWFQHLFSYKNPKTLTKLYLERINNDPYDLTAANLFTSALIRMNLMDSMVTYFDNNEIYLQNSPAIANKRAMVAIMNGNYQRAHSVMETCFLNQDLKVEEFSELYVLSKLLVGDTLEIPMLDDYLDKKDLGALAFYNIVGQYAKADSLAKVFDSKFLGPCIISRYLNVNPLLFHLSATPNFSARIREMGIDPVEYEKEHYI